MGIETPPSYVQLPKYTEFSAILDETADKTLQLRVDILSKRLQFSLPKSHTYTVTVFSGPDSHKVFHFQGRHIALGEQLILDTKNDDELSFIIAHELAHWENKDMSGKTVRIIEGPAIESHECEADKAALKLIEKSGMNTQRVLEFLTRLSGLYGRKSCILKKN